MLGEIDSWMLSWVGVLVLESMVSTYVRSVVKVLGYGTNDFGPS